MQKKTKIIAKKAMIKVAKVIRQFKVRILTSGRKAGPREEREVGV
ncbi:MAG: hypothetical protein AAB573_00260 [Patescibacteria group bacterium]